MRNVALLLMDVAFKASNSDLPWPFLLYNGYILGAGVFKGPNLFSSKGIKGEPSCMQQ